LVAVSSLAYDLFRGLFLLLFVFVMIIVLRLIFSGITASVGVLVAEEVSFT
jgi:hypothetical protein